MLSTSSNIIIILFRADIEAGDGTTSVCVIAGALLNACQALLEKGIHPTQISESFMDALVKASASLQLLSH